MRNRRTRLQKKRSKYRRTRKRVVRGGNIPINIASCDKCHYGDNLFILKFIFNNSSTLKQRGAKVNLYYNTEHCKNRIELEQYVDKEVVTLHPIGQKPLNTNILWMGEPIDGVKFENLEEYFKKYYAKLASILGLDLNATDISLYQKEDYLLDIYNNMSDKYKDLDILIINAEPKSDQFVYNIQKMNDMCMRLKDKYKIATTAAVDDSIHSTMRDNLTMRDIGAISTKAKYIIAVHSGPFVPCYNLHTKNNVKKVMLLLKDDYIFKEMNVTLIKDIKELTDIEKHLV
jgi:hypothetical protein